MPVLSPLPPVEALSESEGELQPGHSKGSRQTEAQAEGIRSRAQEQGTCEGEGEGESQAGC